MLLTEAKARLPSCKGSWEKFLLVLIQRLGCLALCLANSVLPAEQEGEGEAALCKRKTAFPTVRQGAGQVGFPVDIFCCSHPGSARATCPVLAGLTGFPRLLLIVY